MDRRGFLRVLFGTSLSALGLNTLLDAQEKKSKEHEEAFVEWVNMVRGIPSAKAGVYLKGKLISTDLKNICRRF